MAKRVQSYAERRDADRKANGWTPTSTAPMRAMPAERSKWDDEQSFRVWVERPSYLEDEERWKCVAAFMFLQEALDYIAHCQDTGEVVVFQSPAETKVVKPTDRRVVFRAEQSEGPTLQLGPASITGPAV